MGKGATRYSRNECPARYPSRRTRISARSGAGASVSSRRACSAVRPRVASGFIAGLLVRPFEASLRVLRGVRVRVTESIGSRRAGGALPAGSPARAPDWGQNKAPCERPITNYVNYPGEDVFGLHWRPGVDALYMLS